MTLAKNAIVTARLALILALSWLRFWITGETTQRGYLAMIRLFCRTGGRSNDAISHMIALARPPIDLPNVEGVLGRLDRAELASISRQLRESGYYVSQSRLPDGACDRLLSYALSHDCDLRVTDAGLTKGGLPRRMRYDPTNPQGVRYDFSQEEVINVPDVQKLLSDISLLAVAQDYLGSQPIADVTSMWWHTAFGGVPDGEAAQFFHFDMDRVKWLKIFIYLTDVGPENGPHTFVAGSHRTGGIPDVLLERGYARLNDDDVAKYYDPAALIEFSAPRGTILIEDTRGLHKGKHVHSGHRLILQLQFSNSMFGASYSAARFAEGSDPALLALARRYPVIYSNFCRPASINKDRK